jgi:hypothetical protein
MTQITLPKIFGHKIEKKQFRDKKHSILSFEIGQVTAIVTQGSFSKNVLGIIKNKVRQIFI